MENILQAVHDDPENDFNKFAFDFKSRDKELYMYLIKKITNKA